MLLQNYNVFNASPGHIIGGVADPTAWYKGGSAQMFYSGDHLVSGETDKAAFSAGYNTHNWWIPSPKAGGISSHRNTNITFEETAVLAGGLPASGSSTITFTPTGTGGLIVSGSGTATITFSSLAPLVSVASASGSSTITFSTSANIGAEAGLSGSTTISLSGTAVSYAIGYMSGLSTSENEFSPTALAQAVWDALKVDYNDTGTMGEVMNNISAGSNPWDALLVDNNDSGTFGEFVQKLLTVAKFLGLK